MKARMFLVVLVAVAWACVARADEAQLEKPTYFLNADNTVELRVAKIESGQAALEAKIAKLEAQLAKLTGEKLKAAPAAAAAPSKVQYSVCVNGRCTIYEVADVSQVPFGASILAAGSSAAAGSPCPTGPCGDNCGCAGTMTSYSSSSSGGWYLGKALGRKR